MNIARRNGLGYRHWRNTYFYNYVIQVLISLWSPEARTCLAYNVFVNDNWNDVQKSYSNILAEKALLLSLGSTVLLYIFMEGVRSRAKDIFLKRCAKVPNITLIETRTGICSMVRSDVEIINVSSSFLLEGCCFHFRPSQLFLGQVQYSFFFLNLF